MRSRCAARRIASVRPLAAGIVSVFVLLTANGALADLTKHECVVANTAGQDLRQAGKLRAAHTQFSLCVSSSCPGPVRKDCADQLDAVDHGTPTLIIGAKDSSGADLSAVRVSIDGELLVVSLDGTAIAVDPGKHTLTFEGTGEKKELELVILEGQKGRQVAVVMKGDVVAPAVAPVLVAKAPTPLPPPDATASPSPTRRTWGIVTAGAGAAGVVAGSALGIAALVTYNHAKSQCAAGTTYGCGAGGSEGATAHGEAAASTAAFIAGGVLLAAGVTLWLTAPRKESAPVTAWQRITVRAGAAPGTGTVAVGGAW